MNVLQVHHFEKASELLDAFGPARGFLTPRTDFLFRGQAFENWQLLPSLFRDGVLNDSLATCSLPLPVDSSLISKLNGAASLVEEFKVAAIRSFVPLPEDSQFHRNLQLKASISRGITPGQFPPPLDRSHYALAQHHGIPTPLLDWSRDPLVACYFACWTRIEKAMQGDLSDENLTVWALDTLGADTYFNGKRRRLELVTAPYEGNSYLAAQTGVFTLLQWTDDQDENEVLPLETLISGDVSGMTQAVLHKLTLPAPQTPYLALALLNHGYNEAKIKPGVHSLVASMRQKKTTTDAMPLFRKASP